MDYSKTKSHHKKVTFLMYMMPVMLIMMFIVMYQDSKIHNTQTENSNIAKDQRELSIKLSHMILKKMDTVIVGQDSIFLLFKAKRMVQH